MSADPFRVLDRIDPSDQWDDITRRAGSGDLTVDLDGPGRRVPRRRAPALIAVAAAVAVLAGGVVALRTIGDEDPDGVTADTAAPATSAAPDPDPAPDLGGPCPVVLDGEGIPAPEPHRIEVTPDDLPGAVNTAGRVVVDGYEVVVMLGGWSTQPGPILGARGTRDAGVGQPDPETGLVDVTEWLVVADQAPCTDLQASTVTALADVAAAQAVVARVLDAFVTPAGDPVPTTTTVPGDDQMTWEGPLTDGRTYRVEVTGDVIHGFVGDLQISTGSDLPRWLDASGAVAMGMVAFDIVSRPEGGPQDSIVVGARPPDAVETFVLGPDGEVDAPSLTVSPDGRFYAVHGLDLAFMEVGSPWPVRHRDASGALIDQPAGG